MRANWETTAMSIFPRWDTPRDTAIAVTVIANCICGAIMPGHLAVEFTLVLNQIVTRALHAISIARPDDGDASPPRLVTTVRRRAVRVGRRASIDTRDLSQFATAIWETFRGPAL